MLPLRFPFYCLDMGDAPHVQAYGGTTSWGNGTLQSVAA